MCSIIIRKSANCYRSLYYENTELMWLHKNAGELRFSTENFDAKWSGIRLSL